MNANRAEWIKISYEFRLVFELHLDIKHDQRYPQKLAYDFSHASFGNGSSDFGRTRAMVDGPLKLGFEIRSPKGALIVII